jgi:hypothetical protein
LGGLTSPRVVDGAKPVKDSLSQEVINLRSQVKVLMCSPFNRFLTCIHYKLYDSMH